MELDTKKEYYSITRDSSELHVALGDFTEGPRPIVWENFGLLRVISYAQVVNLIGTLSDMENYRGPDVGTNACGVMFWDDLNQD